MDRTRAATAVFCLFAIVATVAASGPFYADNWTANYNGTLLYVPSDDAGENGTYTGYMGIDSINQNMLIVQSVVTWAPAVNLAYTTEDASDCAYWCKDGALCYDDFDAPAAPKRHQPLLDLIRSAVSRHEQERLDISSACAYGFFNIMTLLDSFAAAGSCCNDYGVCGDYYENPIYAKLNDTVAMCVEPGADEYDDVTPLYLLLDIENKDGNDEIPFYLKLDFSNYVLGPPQPYAFNVPPSCVCANYDY